MAKGLDRATQRIAPNLLGGAVEKVGDVDDVPLLVPADIIALGAPDPSQPRLELAGAARPNEAERWLWAACSGLQANTLPSLIHLTAAPGQSVHFAVLYALRWGLRHVIGSRHSTGEGGTERKRLARLRAGALRHVDEAIRLVDDPSFRRLLAPQFSGMAASDALDELRSARAKLVEIRPQTPPAWIYAPVPVSGLVQDLWRATAEGQVRRGAPTTRGWAARAFLEAGLSAEQAAMVAAIDRGRAGFPDFGGAADYLDKKCASEAVREWSKAMGISTGRKK